MKITLPSNVEDVVAQPSNEKEVFLDFWERYKNTFKAFEGSMDNAETRSRIKEAMYPLFFELKSLYDAYGVLVVKDDCRRTVIRNPKPEVTDISVTDGVATLAMNDDAVEMIRTLKRSIGYETSVPINADVEMETMDYLPCHLAKFVINGIEADADDFGETKDLSRGNSPDYGCGNMRFVANDFDSIPRCKRDEILCKYNISKCDYEGICELLERKLDVGHCEACV